jgi:hypothetical protein
LPYEFISVKCSFLLLFLLFLAHSVVIRRVIVSLYLFYLALKVLNLRFESHLRHWGCLHFRNYFWGLRILFRWWLSLSHFIGLNFWDFIFIFWMYSLLDLLLLVVNIICSNDVLNHLYLFLLGWLRCWDLHRD